MSAAKKTTLPKIFDLSLVIAALLTGVFYFVVTTEAMKGTMIQQFTTEHVVEYIIVGFFIWGLVDAVFHASRFPAEFMALKQECLPRRSAREPASNAAMLAAAFRKKPQWLQQSRLGQRLTHALEFLQEKGTADEFSDYLRHLSDTDLEITSAHYALLRFIVCVTPMFGFLGTVVHFGTALSGHSAGEIGDKLSTVVAEMGTAFNTTTVALTAAMTTMIVLFLCERTELAMVSSIDRRTERELLNRFDARDASLSPLLDVFESSSQASLKAIDQRIERQMAAWSSALELSQQQTEKFQQWQTQVWVEALEKIEQRFEVNDAERERRLGRLLESIESRRKEQRVELDATMEQVMSVKADFAQLIAQIAGVASGTRELAATQSVLSQNLRLLSETEKLDQAFHGLTAAIHLLTARHGSPIKEHRAA